MTREQKIIQKQKELIEYYDLFHQAAIGKIKLPDPRMMIYDDFKAKIDILHKQLSALEAEPDNSDDIKSEVNNAIEGWLARQRFSAKNSIELKNKIWQIFYNKDFYEPDKTE